MRPPPKVKVGAEELIRRFEGLGGLVHHYRGRRSCLVTTRPHGEFRTHHSHACYEQWILPTDLTDYIAERLTVGEAKRANRILLNRAKQLSPVTPTLAMLEAHLRTVNIATITNRDEAWLQVNAWCRIIEVCDTREAEAAFSRRGLPALEEVFNRVYGQTEVAK